MESTAGAVHDIPSPTGFFSTLVDRHEEACQGSEGVIARCYRIADCVVQLEFAGPALLSTLCPGLAHLELSQPSQPDFRVQVWDSASTSVQAPRAPWNWSAISFRAEVPSFNTERIRTVFDVGSGALSMLDIKRRQAIYWVRDAERLPAFEAAHPLRTILHWCLALRGRQFVHAAALGYPEGGVLLAGAGGSGKSTSALACLQSPLLYLGDDYCAFSLNEQPRVHSLFATAKASEQTLRFLPLLRPLVSNPEELPASKGILQLFEQFQGRMLESCPIRAILLPKVRVDGADKPTTIEPASAIETIRGLAPSTMTQLPGADRYAWRAITKLVAQVPCYRMSLGRRLEEIPQVIESLLQRS